MIDLICSKNARIAFAGRPSRVAALMLACVLSACGPAADGQRDELLSLVEAEDWQNVRIQAEELRQSGVIAPWLDYADGLAAMEAGDEEEARRLLAAAARADAELSTPIAKAWADAARVDYEQGWRERATARMAEAVLADPSTNPDPMLPAVANYFYRNRKDYEAAWPLYERLVRERPEPANRIPQWVYRWGHLHELRGDLDAAREIYEDFIEEFPRDREQGRYVHWRYCDVLIEQARLAREAGDDAAALELLELAREDGWHTDQQQRVEFETGLILEDQKKFDEARRHYLKVIDYGEMMQTDVVSDARDRLEALDAQIDD